MSEGAKTELALEAYVMYTAGVKDLDTIAGELGRSVQWVRQVLKEQGIVFDKGRVGLYEAFSEADKTDIVERYERGEAVYKICELYHMSSGGFYNLLRKMGIAPRGKAADALEGRKIQNDLAVEMYKEGWVIWYICEETGLHPPDVLKAAREANLPRRGRGHKGRIPAKDADGNYIPQNAIPGADDD